MKLLSMQFAIFTTEKIERPDLLKDEINDKIGKKLNGMPTILDLPQDVPPEIPIVQIKSIDNVFALNVSRTRVDLFINLSYDTGNLPIDTFKEYRSIIDKYYKVVYNSTKSNRVGIVFTLFYPERENVSKIFETFLTEKYSSNNSEISIRTNSQKMEKGIIYNNVRMVEAAEITVGDVSEKGIIVQFDTNNVPLEDNILNMENISDILEFATGNIKTKAVKELI